MSGGDPLGGISPVGGTATGTQQSAADQFAEFQQEMNQQREFSKKTNALMREANAEMKKDSRETQRVVNELEMLDNLYQSVWKGAMDGIKAAKQIVDQQQ